MRRLRLAAVFVALGSVAVAVPASAGDPVACAKKAVATIKSNPYRPLPGGGGGGEPPAPPQPGQPVAFVQHDVNAAVALAKCAAS